MKTKTEALNIRITEETLKQLNELCSIWNLTKTQCIERLIYAEFMKSTEIGKQRLEEVAKAFGIIQQQVEILNHE